MAGRVVTRGECYLGTTYFPLSRAVQRTLSPNTAAKVVIGDTNKDSSVDSSTLGLSDFRGGIGLNKIKGAGEVDRVWYSNAQLSHQGHMVNPPLVTQTADPSLTGTIVLGELSSEIYGAWGTDVRKYSNSSDSWGASLDTLPAAAVDSITVTMGGTTYLVFATTGGYTYTSDGSSFTDDTTDAVYLAFWDDKLWGIDATGQLWYASTIGTETTDAVLPLAGATVTGLFTYRDAGGETILYAATTRGLYAHDFANTKFVETDLVLPNHQDNAKGATKWRSSAYISAGLGVYKYQAGPTAVVTVVGPDRDDGLPNDKRGVITQMEATHNALVAALETTGSSSWDVSLSVFNQAFSVGTQDVTPTGVFFKPDGTKMFVTGQAGDTVEEYTLTAWDVSTASTNASLDISGQGSAFHGLFFRADGKKMYLVDRGNTEVEEYDLSTAWDVTSATHNQAKSVSTEESSPFDVFFKPDGLKMYIVGTSGDEVNEYTLTSAWDISTASASQTFDISGKEGESRGIHFKPDGSRMYIVGADTDAVNEYHLATEWDISTASFVQNFDVSNENSDNVAIFFRPDGTKMYVVGTTTQNEVNEYDLKAAPVILAYNDLGWQVLWDAATSAQPIDYILVSNAYSEYRLWWGHNDLVYWMTLQRDIVNPLQLGDYEYATSAETLTPWFDAGQSEVNKLALKVIAETTIPTTDESVTISYGLNYNEAWTALTAITTNGSTTFELPDSTTPNGVAFRAIRFKIELARGDDVAVQDKFRTPDLNSLSLVYEKFYPPKFNFIVALDLSKPYKGNTPAQMQAALVTLIETNTLSEFTYRNDDSDDRNYYVRIRGASGLEQTGQDERGEVQLQLGTPG